MTENRPLTLAARLLAVMDEVGYIQKQGKTESGPKFNYVRHDDVVATLRPALIKHGVAFMAGVQESTIGCEQVGVTKSGAARYKTTLVLTLTFVNVDDPADAYSVNFPGEGVDTDDKGSGKALSYALKNGLLKIFLIEAGDEADVERSVEPAVDPDTMPLGEDGWNAMLKSAGELGFVWGEITNEASAQGYHGHPTEMPRGLAKNVFRALRDRAPSNAPADSNAAQQDEQREQAARAETQPKDNGNGTLTAAEVEKLRAVIHAKGRTDEGVAATLLEHYQIGDGEHLEGIPREHLAALLEIFGKLPDPEPPASSPAPVVSPDAFAEPAPAPQEAAQEAVAPAAASEPSVEPVAQQAPPVAQDAAKRPDGCTLDASFQTCVQVKAGETPVCKGCSHLDPDWAPLDAATRQDGEARPEIKRSTVTDDQLKLLGMRCAELESLGVEETEWRYWMAKKWSVSSRKELKKTTTAPEVIKALNGWLTDLKTGVEGPGEKAVA